MKTTDRDYLRLPADNPLATAGVGGSTIGALPAGPAKEPDWFIQLRERWGDGPAR